MNKKINYANLFFITVIVVGSIVFFMLCLQLINKNKNCTSQEKVDNLCKKEGDWFDKLILFIIIIIFKLNRSKIF